MKNSLSKLLVVFGLILALPLTTTAFDDKASVSGFGGYALSEAVTSMWLSASDGRPLLMAYFTGVAGWHHVSWKMSSSFNRSKPAPGWVEFKSDKIRQRLWLDGQTGEAEVQTTRFNLRENNTFVIVSTDKGSGGEKIVPLGVFSLPKSGAQPASVLLLKANPELNDRINIEAASR
jgi:hypothetical protein